MNSKSTEVDNPSSHLGVLTSCSQGFQVLLDNPSKHGPVSNGGLIMFHDQACFEIIKRGDSTYSISGFKIPIVLDNSQIPENQYKEVKSGSKITFSIENGSLQETYTFVFLEITTESSLSTHKASVQEILRCALCYFIIQKCVILNCGHHFCEKCIENHRGDTCPNCRQKISIKIRYRELDQILTAFFKESDEEIRQAIEEDNNLRREPQLRQLQDNDGNTYIPDTITLKGEIKFQSGDRFEGTLMDWKIQNGAMIYANGDKYIGGFKDNKKNGQGECCFASGDTFQGTFCDDKMQHGIMTYANGEIYVGGFEDDLKHGYGELRFSINGSGTDISSFEGFFVRGSPENEGAIFYEDGSSYQGELINCIRNGKGGMSYADGSFYEGDWRNGEKHGLGKMELKSGDLFDGIFFHDKMQIGKMTYANGETYIGHWKDDKKHGKGKYIFSNKNIYNGYWKEDEIEGKGTMEYATGDISTFSGSWVNGRAKGDGKFVYRHGSCQKIKY